MLATDPGHEARLRRPALGDGDLEQAQHAVAVERAERVVIEHATRERHGDVVRGHVVAREAEGQLRQVVRPEGERVDERRDHGRSQRRSRRLDHRRRRVRHRRSVLGLDHVGDPTDEPHRPCDLAARGDERDHDLDARVEASCPKRCGSTEQCMDLRLVQPRAQHAQPSPADPQHRVVLAQLCSRRQQRDLLRRERAERLLDAQLLDVRQELVQRGVEQPDDDGAAVHHLEQLLEVGPLLRLDRRERCSLLLRGAREDDPLHEREPVTEELVLGAAQPDALRARGECTARVVGGVGVGVHAQRPALIGPGEQPVDARVGLGHDELDLAECDLAGRAVDRDDLASTDDRVTDGHGPGAHVDRERRGSAHGRDAEPPGDDGGMADESAARRQQSARGDHALEVVR